MNIPIRSRINSKINTELPSLSPDDTFTGDTTPHSCALPCAPFRVKVVNSLIPNANEYENRTSKETSKDRPCLHRGDRWYWPRRETCVPTTVGKWIQSGYREQKRTSRSIIRIHNRENAGSTQAFEIYRIRCKFRAS